MALWIVSALGLAMFVWPLWIGAESELAHSSDAALVFALVLAMLVAVLVAELSCGGMDAKALAMLGVLAAVAAALRPLGTAATGFQPMFVVLILGGRALGPGFGFLLGLVAMFGSALLTGGVGPWLPFQMLGAAWVGMGAGLLPRAEGRREIALVAAYGAVAGVLYGFCLNMWFWPFLTTAAPGLSFEAGAPLGENLTRFLLFCLATSLGFDLPRAAGNLLIVALVGGPLLRSIRRVARRANFAADPTFAAAPAGAEPRTVTGGAIAPVPATPLPADRPAADPARSSARAPTESVDGRRPPGASPSQPPAATAVLRAGPDPTRPPRSRPPRSSGPDRR
jgi:energy-coupling factor transport system substrate-specific component